MSRLNRIVRSVALVSSVVTTAQADIVWVGAVSDDIFDEANWDLSSSSVAVVDPDTTIADNVVIVDAPAPIDVFVPALQASFRVGDGYVMTISNSIVFTSSNDGIGGEPGTTNGPLVEVVNGGDVATYFISNGVHMEIDTDSSAHLAGPANPINGSTIDLTGGALLACTNETVADFITEHLAKISVDGAPAVLDVNVTVEPDGFTGCLVEVILPPVGTVFCSGDGTGTSCPCGNEGAAGQGCANGSFTAGARLEASGELADVTLSLFQATPNQPMLFFQGVNALSGGDGVVFGDGLRCAGGSLVRLGIAVADTGGSATLSGSVQENGGGGAPGETRYYQGWYRDPALSPCGFTFNLSNGVQVDY